MADARKNAPTKLTPDREPCSCGVDHSQAKRCPHGNRHWFTVYGAVGVRRPTCSRCGAPNPSWDTDQQATWEYLSGD